MGVLRVLDSLNYIENLNLSIDAATSIVGFVECTLSYTRDVSDPNRGKYDLDYYIKLVIYPSDIGFFSLSVKYMVVLLTPHASTILVSALR